MVQYATTACAAKSPASRRSSNARFVIAPRITLTRVSASVRTSTTTTGFEPRAYAPSRAEKSRSSASAVISGASGNLGANSRNSRDTSALRRASSSEADIAGGSAGAASAGPGDGARRRGLLARGRGGVSRGQECARATHAGPGRDRVHVSDPTAPGEVPKCAASFYETCRGELRFIAIHFPERSVVK